MFFSLLAMGFLYTIFIAQISPRRVLRSVATSVDLSGVLEGRKAKPSIVPAPKDHEYSTNITRKGRTIITGLCPEMPDSIEGKFLPRMDIVEWDKLEAAHPEVDIGGAWRPKNCIARHRVAVLIPYRNRNEHLNVFMNNMHVFLQRQLVEYRIYVIEQAGDKAFNRALMLNIGFREAFVDSDWQCFVFHDVDHLPLNDRNLYYCPELPRHLSAHVDKNNFRLPYSGYFGGVVSMKTEHYKAINGMSNVYWGWGSEDDDLYYRIRGKGLVPIERYPENISRYITIQAYHRSAPSNRKRWMDLSQWKLRSPGDGLNNLNYTITRREYKKLFTYLLSDVTHMYKK